MELWIRTQDKMRLVKPNRLAIKGDSRTIGEGDYYIYESQNSLRYGTYTTKERALEVLDEIEERIMLINTINIVKDRDSLIAYKNALTEEKIKGLGYPYQMPED